jgi:Xaa-Pro aminopeptidase
MLIAETEPLRQRIQQLEALLHERGSKRYMTISEIEKRYRRNRRRVLTDMHTGLVQFVKREKSRAGKPIYLVREDEAERAWGCGSPV